ncbi:MAG: hypothetical protein HIU91_10040 [Acidobacteria bacterium]|nr:hypothetical protein [Acidobacteriota bacterium]
MKKWEYAQVVYQRNRKLSEPCISGMPKEMEGIDSISCLHVDSFLKAAGENGWELCGSLLPFAAGKELSVGTDDEDDTKTYSVADPSDIQWMIFKREL